PLLVLPHPLSPDHRPLHSFPTRRSSDLPRRSAHRLRRRPDGHSRREAERECRHSETGRVAENRRRNHPRPRHETKRHTRRVIPTDRKSTRLNSSHVEISYAVFCLKKKKN